MAQAAALVGLVVAVVLPTALLLRLTSLPAVVAVAGGLVISLVVGTVVGVGCISGATTTIAGPLK